MSLDMYGLVDPTFNAGVDVTLVTPAQGGYTGPGGTWEEGTPSRDPLSLVTIQQASMRTAEFMLNHGGTANPSDLRVVYITDGTMLYPDDDGSFAQLLEFSDGQAVREWRVREADNRPWRNYCKAVVERYRGQG